MPMCFDLLRVFYRALREVFVLAYNPCDFTRVLNAAA